MNRNKSGRREAFLSRTAPVNEEGCNSRHLMRKELVHITREFQRDKP